MEKKNQFFGFIPARKGSVRVKNKNVIKLNNKSLIEYTFDQASRSKTIDQIYVSSNDDRVLKISKKFKKVKYVKRKNSLSNSKTLMSEVILDFLGSIKKSYDLQKVNLVILQPTSPQRKYTDIDKAVRLFKKKNFKPLISLSEPITNPDYIYYLKDKKLAPLNKSLDSRKRKNIKKFLCINGSIYIVNARSYLKDPNILKKNSTIFEMDKKHSIQIDDYYDLNMMKNLMRVKN